MDNNKQELTKEQEESRKESVERAQAFEGLMMHPGFKYQKAYYENRLKAFVNDLFNKVDKPISDFEGERRELIGLKKLFSEITFEVDQARNERKTNRTAK